MMPASLKERSSRLQMFARLKSDGEAKAKSNNDVTTNASLNGNAVAQQSREPERYQSSAPAFTSLTERRELADSARVPVPGANARQATSHQRRFSQPPPESVQRSHSQSPASQHRQMDIFTGSQLGDSFMNSGLTTPLYEPSEADPEPLPDKRNTVVAAPALAAPTAAPTTITRPPPRYNFDRRLLNEGAAFELGEDLLMRVVPRARQQNPASTYMNDGFNRTAVNGYNRPPGNYRPIYSRPDASPETQPKLPVRDLKVRHVPRPRQLEYNDRDKRSMSPGFATRGRSTRDRADDFRPMARFTRLEEVEDEEGMQGPAYDEENGDQDDGTSTVGDREDGHATPRLRGHPLSPHRAALERLMSTTIPPLKPLPPKDKKRRRGSLDYDDAALGAMSYADLQNEPFDFDPSKVTTQAVSGDTPEARAAKLEQGQRQTEKEQRLMFASMDTEDWEEAGDWFAEQFSEIMHKMRVVRRNKRKVIEGFEKEAASREEAVRQQTVAIDQKLGQMLQDGQRMMTPSEAKAAKQ
ncbi:extracellular mutant protein 11 domain-containing protein [Trichoderma chlorosporum]